MEGAGRPERLKGLEFSEKAFRGRQGTERGRCVKALLSLQLNKKCMWVKKLPVEAKGEGVRWRKNYLKDSRKNSH